MEEGSLSHAAEYALYKSDHAAWVQYVAPRFVEVLKRAEPADKAFRWSMACPELKQAVRDIADGLASAQPASAGEGMA